MSRGLQFLPGGKNWASLQYVQDDPLNDLSVHHTSSNGARYHRAAAQFSRLNHSDPEELLENRWCIPTHRAWRLQTGLRKVEAYPERFGRPRDHYLPTLSIIAMSDWDRARAFCLCGIKNRVGRSQPCHQWTFCPACSYRKRKRAALDAYLTRFQRTQWFLVTVSYQVTFGDDIFDEDDVRLCWEAAHAALRASEHAGETRGLISRSEMHLEGFLPLRYHPHLHAVVDADCVDRAFLAERVFAYRSPGVRGRIQVPVSIKHHRLGSERAFANALSYVNKSLDIGTPYEQAWPRAAAEGRRLAPELNQEVDNFLDGLAAFTADAHQVRYLGTCHHAHRHTLRVPPAQRRADRDIVSAILVDSNFDQWDEDAGEAEPATLFDPPRTRGRSSR